VLYVGNTVYIGGAFSKARGLSGVAVTRHNAAAIDARTGRLLAWNPNTNGEVRALAAVPGGIALGGGFGTVHRRPHANLAVVDRTAGSPTSFSGSVNSRVRALATGPTGRLYVGGGFTEVNGRSRTGLAAFNGNRLSPWAPRATGGAVLTLRVAGGRVYAGGTFRAVNRRSSAGFLAAVKPAGGRVIRAFNPVISIPVEGLAVNSTTVYAAANGPGGRLRAFRVSTGRGIWAVKADGGVAAVTVDGSDIYFGGHFDHVGTAIRHKLALVNAAGMLQGWAPNADSQAGVLSLANNGRKVGAGGAFTSFTPGTGGTVRQPHFAQFR
jgi:hypothetical protein